MYTYINYNAALENMRRYAQVEQCEMVVDNKLEEQPEMDDTFTHSECNEILNSQATTVGPRVLIMGTANSGKATLTKILGNFSVRCGHKPILADLDTTLNMLSLPGCVTALQLDNPINVEVGFNHSNYPANQKSRDLLSNNTGNNNNNSDNLDNMDSMNNISGIDGIDGSGSGNDTKTSILQITNGKPLNNVCNDNWFNQMIYFYGYSQPTEKTQLYKNVIDQLSLTVKRRLVRNLPTRASGVFIKCHQSLCNISDKSSKSLLDHIIKSFKINVIFVIDKELVFRDLQREFKQSNMECENPHMYQMHMSHNGHNSHNGMSNSGNGGINNGKLLKAQKYVAVVSAPKSSGVWERQQIDRSRIAQRTIENYFYGPFGLWKPRTLTVNMNYSNHCEICAIEHQTQDLSLLPADEAQKMINESDFSNGNELSMNNLTSGSLVKENVSNSRALKNQILAILMADNFGVENERYRTELAVKSQTESMNGNVSNGNDFGYDETKVDDIHTNKILESNVIGFCHATEEANKNFVRLLLPLGDRIPNKVFLKGNITWHRQ